MMNGVDAAASANTAVAARYASEASVSILKKAIDTATETTAALVDTMLPAAALPPAGNVGHHIDVKI
jgi:Putative motility protein